MSCVSLAQARPWRSSAASTLAGASWLGSDGTENTSPKPWAERFASLAEERVARSGQGFGEVGVQRGVTVEGV